MVWEAAVVTSSDQINMAIFILIFTWLVHYTEIRLIRKSIVCSAYCASTLMFYREDHPGATWEEVEPWYHNCNLELGPLSKEHSAELQKYGGPRKRLRKWKDCCRALQRQPMHRKSHGTAKPWLRSQWRENTVLYAKWRTAVCHGQRASRQDRLKEAKSYSKLTTILSKFWGE